MFQNDRLKFVRTGFIHGIFHTEIDTLPILVRVLSGTSDEELYELALAAEESLLLTLRSGIAAAMGSRGLLQPDLFRRDIRTTADLRGFCRVILEGRFGRKSFGSRLATCITSRLRTLSLAEVFLDDAPDLPSIGSIVRACHPKPENENQAKIFASAISGQVTEEEGLALVREADARQLIHSLPRLRSQTWWDHDYDLLVIEMIGTPDFIWESGIGPLEIRLSAECQAQLPTALTSALLEAAEHAAQMPERAQFRQIAVGIDVGNKMTQRLEIPLKALDLAALVATSLKRRTAGICKTFAFDSFVHEIEINPHIRMQENSSRLFRIGGGESHLPSTISYLTREHLGVDHVFLITSEISEKDWTELQVEWQKYTDLFMNSELIICQLAHKDQIMVPGSPSISVLNGWSDAWLDPSYIQRIRLLNSPPFEEMMQSVAEHSQSAMIS